MMSDAIITVLVTAAVTVILGIGNTIAATYLAALSIMRHHNESKDKP